MTEPLKVTSTNNDHKFLNDQSQTGSAFSGVLAQTQSPETTQKTDSNTQTGEFGGRVKGLPDPFAALRAENPIPKILEDASIKKDVDADGLYTTKDITTVPLAESQLPKLIADKVAADPKVKVVAIGEVHGELANERPAVAQGWRWFECWPSRQLCQHPTAHLWPTPL